MWSEIFGVIAPHGMSPAHLAAATRLEAAYAGQDVQRVALPWARVGAATARGSSSLACTREGSRHLLVAGQLPADPRHPGLAALATVLRAGVRDPWPERAVPLAGCLLDDEARSACLFGDRAGLVPLYVAAQGEALAFAGRPGPLLRAGLAPRELDAAAVVELLHFEHLLGTRCLHRGLEVLPAAGRWDVGPAGLRASRPTEPAPLFRPWGLDEFSDRLHLLLGAAVARGLAGRERVGITLSGGLDSRALLGYALGLEVPIRTYTFGLAGSGDARFARALADRAGVPNVFLPIDGSFLPRWLDHAVEITGGMVGATHFHVLSLLDVIAGECSVVLDGLGGDMLSGAHLRLRLLRPGSLERAVQLTCAAHARGLAEPAIARLLRPEFLRGADHDVRAGVRAHFDHGRSHWRSAHEVDRCERQRRFIQYGPHHFRHALDVVTPFYDPEVQDLFRGAPLSLLLEQRAYLRLHARHLRELARVPDSARGLPLTWPLVVRSGKRALDWGRRRLPPSLRRGRAEPPPTTDYAAWFRGSCRPLLQERLLDGSRPLDECVVPAELERLVREHLSGQHDHSTALGSLLALSTWLRSLRP